ncbi:MAG: hypothetical protein IJ906_14525, partial [Oscillospiraceae bacterium]|nr:hypothetical protein [Oscillospiraceae bacterium]
DLYADFIDKGLCEWAMYFNYAVAKYPHRFHCLPYVSMGWPGNITDWKLEIQPGDFLFENHYSTLYEEGQVFAGLHEDFCGRTVEENQIKIFRFSRHLQKQREGQRMFEAYCASYRNQYREEPPFIVTQTPEGGLRIVLPAYLTVQADAILRIPVQLDKRLTERYGKGILLNYWFSDENGEQLSTIGRTSAALDTFSLLLPVATPASPQQCLFHLQVIPNGNGDAADSTVWAMIV